MISKNVILVAIGSNLANANANAIAIANSRFAAAAVTGSSAMLAEAFHSFVDNVLA